jgi:hypothetical protein
MPLLEILIIFPVSLFWLWLTLQLQNEFIRLDWIWNSYCNFRNSGIGLLVGLLYNAILLISSGGLLY